MCIRATLIRRMDNQRWTDKAVVFSYDSPHLVCRLKVPCFYKGVILPHKVKIILLRDRDIMLFAIGDPKFESGQHSFPPIAFWGTGLIDGVCVPAPISRVMKRNIFRNEFSHFFLFYRTGRRRTTAGVRVNY